MKSQPIYLVSRVADRFGNPFTNPNLYTAYSLGDIALQSRVRTTGSGYQLGMNLNMMWNFMTIQTSDPTARTLYNQLVPSYYPLT